MPRKARPRPTTGAHPNRSDLDAAPTQPIRAATGQPYGQRGAQVAAQSAVPLPDNAGALSAAIQAATAMAPPPDTMIGAPDDRPDLPVTAGLSIGAGPGPEVLSSPAPAVNAAAIYRALAEATGDVDYELMANRAEGMGL